MRELLTADLHLSDHPRDEYRFRFVEQRLPKLLKHYAVDTLYILGDLTEQKDYHSARLVNRIMDALVAAAEHAEVVWLRGNHDYSADMDNPFFGFIGYVPNLHYIGQPTRRGADLLLPHTRDPQTEWRGLDLAGVQMILAHATFAGAIGANGMPLPGIDPPSATIRIISGDVHTPQTHANITYVGSPYSIDFGDDFAPRLLLREADGITSLKLKGPQKRVLTIDKRGLEGTANPGDIVRIKYRLERADYDRWAELREDTRGRAQSLGYIVESVLPLVDAAEIIASAHRNSRGPQSDAETLTEYCQKYQVDERTAKQGQELL
jgi:calcineurin-like phosphoesterase family protein